MNFKNKRVAIIAYLISALLVSACTQNIAGAVKKHDGAEAAEITMPERNAINQTVTYMKGDLRFSTNGNIAKTPEEKTFAFLHARRETLLIRNPDEEFKIESVQKDNLGYIRVRLSQQYQEIPVWNGHIALHFNPDGIPYLFRGEYFPTPSGIDVHAGLDGKQLLKKATRVNPSINITDGHKPGKKWIYFVNDKQPVLARELKSSSQPMPADSYILDAITGKLLYRSPGIQTQRAQ